MERGQAYSKEENCVSCGWAGRAGRTGGGAPLWTACSAASDGDAGQSCAAVGGVVGGWSAKSY